MKKNFRTILLASMIIASLSLVACNDKKTSEENETTSAIETTTDEETSEETTTSSEVESTTKEEVTSIETTTIEETTTKEETTTQPPTTTKAPETTTPKPTTTQAPTTTKKPQETTTKKVEETTTQKPIVESESIKKLKSLHIANMPKEALDFGIKLVEGQGYVMVYGPTYRIEADYVDEDHLGANCSSQYQDICEQDGTICDGHSPIPYTLNEWTERKYWGDKDEVTVGY